LSQRVTLEDFYKNTVWTVELYSSSSLKTFKSFIVILADLLANVWMFGIIIKECCIQIGTLYQILIVNFMYNCVFLSLWHKIATTVLLLIFFQSIQMRRINISIFFSWLFRPYLFEKIAISVNTLSHHRDNLNHSKSRHKHILRNDITALLADVQFHNQNASSCSFKLDFFQYVILLN
ncbi:hypothetical protein L9F63_011671, partial [Diploptera punctata]